MMNLEQLKLILESHPKAKNIFQLVNGKRDYKEISKLVGIHETTVSGILAKGSTFGFLNKEATTKFYKKTKELKSINLNQIVKTNSTTTTKEIKVKSKKKKTDTIIIKKQIRDFILNFYSTIEHPFTQEKEEKISKQNLELACTRFFNYLSQDVNKKQLEGLELRFLEAFANYFSCSRIDKATMTSAFSNLVRCYEPYLKKVAAIKTDIKFATSNFDQELAKAVVSFNAPNIKDHKPESWKDKKVHEATIRYIYPYRHIESHEARIYAIHQMERTIFYMFAAIIFINLNY